MLQFFKYLAFFKYKILTKTGFLLPQSQLQHAQGFKRLGNGAQGLSASLLFWNFKRRSGPATPRQTGERAIEIYIFILPKFLKLLTFAAIL
ncbi:MAG: hypothetical protein ACO1NZ_02705 [Adhaeribacter sp.]